MLILKIAALWTLLSFLWVGLRAWMKIRLENKILRQLTQLEKNARTQRARTMLTRAK